MWSQRDVSNSYHSLPAHDGLGLGRRLVHAALAGPLFRGPPRQRAFLGVAKIGGAALRLVVVDLLVGATARGNDSLLVRNTVREVVLGVGALQDHARGNGVGAIVDPVARDEDVEPLGHHQTRERDNDDHVHEGEADNVQRVSALSVEAGVRHGEEHADNGSGDVLEDRAEDHGEQPVVAMADDRVEVATELVAL